MHCYACRHRMRSPWSKIGGQVRLTFPSIPIPPLDRSLAVCNPLLSCNNVGQPILYSNVSLGMSCCAKLQFVGMNRITRVVILCIHVRHWCRSQPGIHRSLSLATPSFKDVRLCTAVTWSDVAVAYEQGRTTVSTTHPTTALGAPLRFIDRTDVMRSNIMNIHPVTSTTVSRSAIQHHVSHPGPKSS